MLNYQTFRNLRRFKGIVLFRIISVFFGINNQKINNLKECSLIYEFDLPLKNYLSIKFKTKAEVISFYSYRKRSYLLIFIKYFLSNKLVFKNSFNLKNFRDYSNYCPEYIFVKKNNDIKLENIQNSQIQII